VIAKAPGDRESAGLPHSAAMARKLGGAPHGGPAEGDRERADGWGILKARELQSGMISNHAELKLVMSRELQNHGPSAPANLKWHDSEARVEARAGKRPMIRNLTGNHELQFSMI